MGNKNFRRPKQPQQPCAAAPAIQRITELQQSIELEQRFERRHQALVLADLRRKYRGDIPARVCWDFLADRRESVKNTQFGGLNYAFVAE